MAAAHTAPSEVETPEEEADPVKEVIRWVEGVGKCSFISNGYFKQRRSEM